MNKKLPLLAASLVAASAASSLSATIIAAEGFNSANLGSSAAVSATQYNTNNFTVAQIASAASNASVVTPESAGFSAANIWNNNSSSARVTSTSLTHSGVAGATGAGSLASNPATLAASGGPQRNVNRVLGSTPTTLGTYYFSTLVRYTDANAIGDGAITTIGFYDAAAVGAPNTNDAIYTSGFHVGLQRSGSNFNLIAFSGADTATPLQILGSAAINTTYQIVIQFNASTTGNESITAWYAANGDTSLTSTSVSATSIGETFSSGASIGRLALQSIGGVNGGTSNTALFDEVRLGTTFADVTTTAIPEPSTYAALVGLGILGFAATRRRRQA